MHPACSPTNLVGPLAIAVQTFNSVCRWLCGYGKTADEDEEDEEDELNDALKAGVSGAKGGYKRPDSRNTSRANSFSVMDDSRDGTPFNGNGTGSFDEEGVSKRREALEAKGDR